MLTTVAVHGFRSLRDVVLPMGSLTVVTGANGTGKSSLYAALHLLSETASGSLIGSLARAGGLESVLWAGPEHISRRMQLGEAPVQGTGRRTRPVSLMLGFTTDELGYLVDVGLPQPSTTMFRHDPLIKRELVWAGPTPRPAAHLVRRANERVQVRDSTWTPVTDNLSQRESILGELSDPERTPELLALRRQVRNWRFHDAFRTDADAPARQPQITTWTPVMSHDGSDFVPAVQTILESSFAPVFARTVAAAFPGGVVSVVGEGPRAELRFQQEGLLRPLSASELSDGTLRYLLLATALCSPRPAGLLVLNEPETSLHPDVLPGLADLIVDAAGRTQVLVVSHSQAIVDRLRHAFTTAERDPTNPRAARRERPAPLPLFDGDAPAVDEDTGDPGARGDDTQGDDSPEMTPGHGFVHHHLVKRLGETVVDGQGLLTRPAWDWGSR